MTKLSWLWLLFQPAVYLRNSLWGCTSIIEIKLNKGLQTVSETEYDIYSLKIEFKTCCFYQFLTWQQHTAPILATVRFLYNQVCCKGSRDILALLQFLTFMFKPLEQVFPTWARVGTTKETMQCPTWTLTGADPSPLHSTGEARSGVLGPALVSKQQRHGHTGASCVKGHKDDEGTYEEQQNQLELFS